MEVATLPIEGLPFHIDQSMLRWSVKKDARVESGNYLVGKRHDDVNVPDYGMLPSFGFMSGIFIIK